MRIGEINLITGNRFFQGPTDQETAAKDLYGEVGGINPNVENRWNNYQNPYGFGDISKKVNDTFGGYEDIINRSTAEQISKQQSGAASSLASRGITDGSVLTDTQSGIASDINKGKANALSELGSKKAGMLSSLMEYFNNMKMKQTGAASDVDFGNMDNLFKKYGLKGNAMEGLDDSGWFDDALGILNTAGGLMPGIGSLLPKGGGAASGGG